MKNQKEESNEADKKQEFRDYVEENLNVEGGGLDGGGNKKKKKTESNEGETSGATSAALPFAATAAAIDGPVPIGDVVGSSVLVASAAYDLATRKYITYTLKNPITRQVYVGRASGFGDPISIMNNRFAGHHMKAFGFGDPQLDAVAQGYPVGYSIIRGREQDLVDAYGGIGSPILANSINPIWKYNPSKPIYMMASKLAFPPLK